MAERGYQAQEAAMHPFGRSEVGDRLAALTAADCALGSWRDWPAQLRSALALILPADTAMGLFWGGGNLAFYNDAYISVIGSKHPRVLGRPAAEGWTELWDDLEPIIEQVRATGETISERSRAFYVERGPAGTGEVAYFDYSFSPVLDGQGEVAGVFHTVADTTDRVRAARSIAEERARLGEMFDQSPSFMAVLRQPGHVIELANHSFMEMIGRRDVIGMRVVDLLPADARRRLADFLDQLVQSRQAYRGSGVRAPIAADRYVDLVVQPVADRNGAIGALFIDGSDVTDRVRAEERLLLSTESLRFATEGAEVGIWDLDLRTDALTWSEQTKAHFGVGATAPVSMDDFYAGVHPDDLDATMESFAAALDPERRAVYDAEYRTIGAEDGAVRWIAARGRGVFDVDGTCIRAVGVTVDITPRKQAEATLRESEQRFQMLADSVPALMWITGPDGRVEFVNHWFEELLGLSLADVQRGGWLVIVHPDERAGLASARAETFAARQPWGGELRVQDRHGRERWIHAEGRPRLIDGEFAGFIGCAVDVTDAHLAAEALEARVAERTAELSAQIEERERVEATLHQMQRLEAVGQLTSGVAHDFNNLLTIVVGNAGLVERAARAGGLDARTLQRIENIRTAAERGAALTQQLLAFSRKQRLATRVVDLNTMIRSMRPLLEGAIGNALMIELDLADGLWPALVDQTQIELAVLNLSINARDATEVGGTVTIRTANVLRGEPSHAEHPPAGEHVAVTVCDTGAGMPPEVVARVFEPFFTTKPVGKGSGLGLAQVYGFAKQSGGGVSIDTAPGEGTAVTVFLPRAEAAPAPPSPPTGEVTVDLSRRVVLVVDDDDAVRQVTADTLTDLGAIAVTATGGEEALKLLAQRTDVELVLADFAMPGMNGAELARRVAAARPGLPFLVLTGYADLREIADVPTRNIIQKPATPAALRDRVWEAIATRA